MAVVGISAGLLERNISRIADAYWRVHEQVAVQQADRVDGIKPDGSFQQHTGIIYDGNYGKDFSNSLIELELQALGTQFEASGAVKLAFGYHLGGARWMTYTNVLKGVVHWDLSVIGRYITYPVADFRASTDLRMDLSQVLQLGRAWNQPQVIQFGSELTGEKDDTANSGSLIGTRVFWSSDYIVHRTENTVITLKMLSNRTTTSECVNEENPFGFHLSDGVTYSYSTGGEYEDMYATLDWNIPPGITTDYNATQLGCNTTARQGIDSYAGGVSGRNVSMGAMRYVNPFTRSLSFFKAWFFFPDNVQHVLVSNIHSSSAAPVSSTETNVQTLWHGGTGYAFTSPRRVGLSLETKTGSWRNISLSSRPPSTKSMFAAWVVHEPTTSPLEYSILPATQSNRDFESKLARTRPQTIVNSASVSAAIDSRALVLGAAFWATQGGGVTINQMGIRVEVDRGVVLVLDWDDSGRTSGRVSIADPNHGAGTVNVRIRWTAGTAEESGRVCMIKEGQCFFRNSWADSVLTLSLPRGGMAGSAVGRRFQKSG